MTGSPSTRQSARLWPRRIVVVGLTAGFVYYLTQQVDVSAVCTLLQSAPTGRVLLLAIFSLGAYAWLPTWRWQRTLRALGHTIGPGSLLLGRWGSQPMKTVIPFKGGEAFRAIWLKKRHNVPLLDGAASIIFDMFLVAIAQLAFLAVGLSLAGSELQHAVVPATVLLSLGVGLSSREVQRLGVHVAHRIHHKLGHIAERLAHGFLQFPWAVRLRLLVISLWVEFSEIVSMWVCCWVLGLQVPPSVVLLSMPIVMGVTLIPITLSGFGTREMAILYLFSAYGTPEELMAAALLFTGVEFLLPTVTGLVLLPIFLSRISSHSEVALRSR